ncbi:TetR/AcrR family transcriptional regulator [Cohnella candidum]|uniref:TetR/AcrR family transcriptional regulator n=1 Tax=Cohnella candidum TaxID=2674991 RepID=A0A3G3K0Z4_9BACL|nr:TetR/AcrR family transcriptional regulator [Cohnella candidum]AYQ73717.1 TetR/AcrR family transcriptional regulator [Cohnella candidum]
MEPKKQTTDPRILRTRQLIRDAFVELLQEMDIEKLSVNKIAEKATINRVTFYLHYRDIPDMLEKMADEMIAHIERIVGEAPEDPNADSEARWQAMVSLLEHIAEQSKFYKVVLASKRTPIFTDRLLQLLTKMMETRVEAMKNDSYLIKAGVREDIATWYFSAALIGTIVAWLRKDMPYTPQFLAKQFSLLLPQYSDKET